VGPFNPQPILFYNSLSPASSEFGFGWNNLFKQMLYFPKSLPWKTDN
jgi:hypothetical protein